jgi:uncharacterized coiled-coil protein SlyX
MRPDRASGLSLTIGVLAVAALFALPCSAFAQTATSTEAAIAELRQLIADQRAALDRQAQIIAEQGRTLTALQQQVEAANPGTPDRREPVTAAAAVETQPPQSQPASRTAAERAPDLPSTIVAAGDFPGSIRIPGTESAFRLGGQARMVAVHSLSALGTDDRFVTSSIPVGIPSAGEDARTVYSPAASRLSTDLRMPSGRGPIRTFIESDFAGSGRTMRLRHAFIQSNHFVVGQTWSTFSDPEAEPIGIDFEGLNAISLFRQPQIRWTRMIHSRYDLALALENPSPDLTGAQGVSLTPDFIVRLRWEPERKLGLAPLLGHTAHVQAAVIVRQLRGEITDQPDVTLTTGGVGVNVSGDVVPRWDADDRVKFAANLGQGIGRYLSDLSSLGGQDAVYDAIRVRLRGLPVSSGYFGYERAWSRVFTTAVTYGVVVVNNLDIQPDDALHRTQRTSINLMWNPIPMADIVLEFLAGTRVNKNGERGVSSQIQAGWTFKF